ncbi:hypothetical protein D3C87_1990860 [compost metagenome]
MLALNAGPGWAGDDLARLGLDIAETNLLVFFVDRQMGMVAPGNLAEGFPGFDRHMAVGFRGKRQDHL